MNDSRSGIELNAREYCRRHDCQFVANQSFGFGVHGSVFGCLRATSPGQNALKIHERDTSYQRERDVYLRLRDHAVKRIEGHHVPQLIDYDDDLLAIEMTVVTRPFVLDFGGAYLDHPPDYSNEVMEEWRRDKEEQFGDNWPKAEAILGELRWFGIYVADVNPGNIGFVEGSD